MNKHEYNGLAQLVNGMNGTNGKAEALTPGEIRFGNVRFHPQTNDRGEATVRLHVTNEVEMLIVKNRLVVIKACMWVIISALCLATGSGLIVFFHAH